MASSVTFQRVPPESDLLGLLRGLEVELHHPGVRCSVKRLRQLLHADFHEVGRSGRVYDLETVVDFLSEQTTHPSVVPQGFKVDKVAPGAALLTYQSAHRQEDGSLAHHTHRSSLWLKTAVGWQLRYHQGTPAAEIW